MDARKAKIFSGRPRNDTVSTDVGFDCDFQALKMYRTIYLISDVRVIFRLALGAGACRGLCGASQAAGHSSHYIKSFAFIDQIRT